MKRTRKYFLLSFLFLIIAAILFAFHRGYAHFRAQYGKTQVTSTNPPQEKTADAPETSILQSVAIVEGPGVTQSEAIAQMTPEPVSFEEQGHYREYEIRYDGVCSVVASIHGVRTELKKAIQDGLISASEIVAQAERDAKEGICAEYTECGSGFLTVVDYRYPNFTMGVINDQYNSPNGEAYRFKYISFGPPNTHLGTPELLKQDEEALIRIDQEEWGITLEASEVTDSGLILTCAQSGVHLNGDLYLGEISSIAKMTSDGWEMLDLLPNDRPQEMNQIISKNKQIHEGQSVRYSVSWDETFGPLESGSYNMRIFVYKTDKNNPNPHVIQKYKVQFTIP